SGQVECVQQLVDRGVTDGVEPGLHSGGGALGDVRGDVGRLEPQHAAGVRPVGVRRGEGGGVRAERAVDEQVAGGARRAQFTGGGDPVQLTPVADDLGDGFGAGQLEQVGEVV